MTTKMMNDGADTSAYVVAAMRRDDHGEEYPAVVWKVDAVSRLDALREVTPQEQGIEIYDQWMGLLKLEKLYDELQREISELAGYVENKIEAETNSRLAMITSLAFLFLSWG